MNRPSVEMAEGGRMRGNWLSSSLSGLGICGYGAIGVADGEALAIFDEIILIGFTIHGLVVDILLSHGLGRHNLRESFESRCL